MDTLRIILIAGGLALLLGIYLWDRIRSRKRDEPGRWQDIEIEGGAGRHDPLISNDSPFDDEWEVIPIPARRDPSDVADNLEGLKGIVALSPDDIVDGQAEAAPPEEEVIILSLMAREGETFNGMQLLDAMEMTGLHHGDMGIFHYTELESGKSLFSVANVLEPGSFDRENMGDIETPGLAMFMQLPAPIDGEKALLTFVQQAKRLKEQLSGHLTDGQRRELTRETLDDLKSTARRFRVSAE
jgi:cell division protein ZipA